MRVITGRFKGRRLLTVGDRSVRPATDRVKQVIFDTLASRLTLEGSVVLDLFAGSGSLGIEALSRGAAHCSFVEFNRDAADCIIRNLRSLGSEDQAEVVRQKAEMFLAETDRTFDLIFADPPYRYAETGVLPSLITGRGRLRSEGYLLIEHTAGQSFDLPGRTTVALRKTFGSTVVSFFMYS